ncbi:MAG: nucleotidyltransferase family protein [Gemmatimonadota bacterium]
MTDKAVILARGLGTRMRQQDERVALTAAQAAVAETGVKALVPIDRPFLDYVLHVLAEAGYRRICLVIGPEHEDLRSYYGRQLTYERLEVSFAVQEEPLGTANAVAAAEAFAAGDPFLMINSDNYYPVEAVAALRQLEGPGLAAFERDSMLAASNIPAERITRFAVVEVDGDSRLRRIIEKPSPEVIARLPEPVSISMNCWRFEAAIFRACAAIKPSERGELEITDAVQYAIDALGQRFTVLPFHAAVLDLTSRTDVGAVAERLAGKPVRL